MAMIGLTVMEIEDYINNPQKSNMAANNSDLNELRKLDSPSTDMHIYEI